MNKHFFSHCLQLIFIKIDTKQSKAIENLTKSNP